MNIANANDSRHPVWFRSSYSNGAGGECVECALTGDEVLVRDSKLATGPVITLTGSAWHAFIDGVLET
ncbi:DUF397 domain-containing protein [Streptomyces canus]|uniref:DUF397 domain-containing protein n=1 Tax=Streptomyces canus TaxID=58343 RepID=UPI002E32C13F|nr:DUF397 domain-containing protein [Streptomyces canus]